MGTLFLALIVLLQPPSPAAQPTTPPGAASQEPAPPPPRPEASSYTYNPEGRRDPFLSLIGAGVDPRSGAASRRGEGIAGMTIAEISVRGVLQSRGSFIAMVQGPDNRTYMVRQGDKLVDGTVQSVTAEGLVIVQEVNDPLSLVKQRVIRKPLRSLEDAKQ